MSDIWSTSLFQASFAGVAFDCLATQDSIDRAVARHTFPRRDGANLEDMGAEPRSTSCQVLFWERSADEGDEPGNHLVRFAAFKAAVDAGLVADFVHPITGTYRAMVANFGFEASAEERDLISCACTFVEDTTQPAKFDPGSQLTVDSGAAATAANAKLAKASLDAAGIDSSVADETSSIVDNWESDSEMTVRQVNLELASVNQKLDDTIETYELTSDVTNYTLWRRIQSLNYSARRAAALFRQSQPQTIQITVAEATPLRALVASTYGANDAEVRYSEIMRLNEVDDPSLIPAGTVLRAPAPNTSGGR